MKKGMILQKPLTELELSAEFMTMAKANGYKTLQDILNEPLHELPFKPKSSYRILNELLAIFELHGLSKMIDDLSEST